MPISTPQHPEAPVVSEKEPGIVMYTTRWCGDCRRAKRIFAALNVPYAEVDIEEDKSAAEFVTRVNGGWRTVPTILFPDGTMLIEPANAVLEARLTAYTRSSR